MIWNFSHTNEDSLVFTCNEKNKKLIQINQIIAGYFAPDSDSYLIFTLEKETSLAKLEFKLSENSVLPVELKCKIFKKKTPFLLDSFDDRKITILCSSSSGTKIGSKLVHNVIIPLLNEFNCKIDFNSNSNYNYIETFSREDIINFGYNLDGLENSKKIKKHTIIFLCGDTGLFELFNSTINNKSKNKGKIEIDCIIIPCGTGNALTSSLKISLVNSISILVADNEHSQLKPLPLFKILLPKKSRIILSGGIESIPLNESKLISFDENKNQNQLENQYFSLFAVVVASWGFHAALVADSDTPEYRKLGPSRFGKAAKNNLEMNISYKGDITLKNPNMKAESFNGPFSYVLFTSVRELEKNFLISPKGEPLSGSVFLVAIPMCDPTELMSCMTDAYKEGAHISRHSVVYKEVTDSVVDICVKNEREANRRFCIDGQIFIIPKNEVVKIDGKSLLNGMDIRIKTLL